TLHPPLLERVDVEIDRRLRFLRVGHLSFRSPPFGRPSQARRLPRLFHTQRSLENDGKKERRPGRKAPSPPPMAANALLGRTRGAVHVVELLQQELCHSSLSAVAACPTDLVSRNRPSPSIHRSRGAPFRSAGICASQIPGQQKNDDDDEKKPNDAARS